MNKGLEALNGIKSYIDTRIVKYPLIQYVEVIETALKNYEKTKKELKLRIQQNGELVSQLAQNDKKLKALEIIKKEIGDCLEFYWDEEHDYGEVWCIQNEEESRVLIASANSKEEYDLLKEVLL